VKLTIINIGPIKEANLEIGDKTVIVGPNNSGKTFLATAFYSLVNIPITPHNYQLIDINLSPGENEYEIKFKKDELEKFLTYALTSYFGVPTSKIVTTGQGEGVIENDNAKIILKKDGKVEVEIKKKLKFLIKYREGKVGSGVLHFVKVKDDNEIIEIEFEGDKEIPSHIINDIIITESALRNLFSMGWDPTAFVSVERIAFRSFKPLISYSIFSPFREITPIKPLSLDALRWVEPTEFEIFGHKVRVEISENGLPIIKAFLNGEEVVPSSGIDQFAIIESVTRNPKVRGMIIEEPELTLHIDAEIEAGRRLSRYDKKLFITTHGDFLTMTIAYLLREKVKVYELVDGKAKERKVSEDGLLEELETIGPISLETIKKMLEGKFE